MIYRRTDLRNILLDSLAPGTVKWGHRVTEVKALSPDSYEISFQSQPAVRASLLVGADGAFSRVRPLIHLTQPVYTGVTMYDLQISPYNLTPSLKALIGNGTCIALDDGKGLFPQMNSGGRCRVYAAISAHAIISNEEPWPEAGKRRQWLIKLCEDWDERYKELIMASDEETATPRRIYAFDPAFKWTGSETTGVTIIGEYSRPSSSYKDPNLLRRYEAKTTHLIGDAAHVMAPSGEGVNLALADALDLGKALVNLFAQSEPPSRKQIRDAISDFEKIMMDRAHPEMEISERMLEKFYGPSGGAGPFTEMLKLMMQGASAGQA